MTKNNLEQAWQRLLTGQRLCWPVTSDRTAIPSAAPLRLAHVLHMGKDVRGLAEDGVPEHLSFIPESEWSSPHRPPGLRRGPADRLRGDQAQWQRGRRRYQGQSHRLHRSSPARRRVRRGEGCGSQASATAELLAELFEANDVALDQTAATQLMTGLISDTGALRFANTTPRTFGWRRG